MENTLTVSDKDNSKQLFSTLDVFKILGSCLLVIGITLNILHKNNQEQKLASAKISAKSYAEELIAESVKSSHVRTLRNPASSDGILSGNLGKDPWGQPYSYRVIQNSYGQPVYMVVVSPGPNAVLDTPLSEVSFQTSKNAQIDIIGDDVGYLKSFR